MRKIMSREELDRKREKNNKIIVVILGLIMLFSTAGYFATEYSAGGTKKLVYNGITFRQDDNSYWAFAMSKNSYLTKYSPEETKNITNNLKMNIGNLSGKTLYFDITDKYAYSTDIEIELTRNLNYTLLKTYPACTNSNCTEDLPIKNCETDTIVKFKVVEQNSNINSNVEQDNNCIIFNYKAGDSEMLADSAIYRLLGLQ